MISNQLSVASRSVISEYNYWLLITDHSFNKLRFLRVLLFKSVCPTPPLAAHLTTVHYTPPYYWPKVQYPANTNL